MDSITIRLPEETLDSIERESEERGISKSEVIREWFRDREELQRKCTQLQSECDELQTERDRVQNEKRLILEQSEEHTELVREVRKDRTLAERKARAGLLTKAKWALFGMNTDEEGGTESSKQ